MSKERLEKGTADGGQLEKVLRGQCRGPCANLHSTNAR